MKPVTVEAKMKAISLWQPWAEMVKRGFKKYETRSFDTRHRGILLIHAAKTKKGIPLFPEDMDPFYLSWRLEYGRIICAVIIEATYKTEDIVGKISPLERSLGDYSPGRYAWKFKEVINFKSFEQRGSQGFFNVDAAIRIV